MEKLEFYVVRNKEGKYLRAKGYNGYGDSWVEDLKRAKVYTKKGGASGQITWWATHWPDYGIPDLVPLTATLGEPIDQTERIAKVRKEKEVKELTTQLWSAKMKVQQALTEMEHIKGPGWFKDKLVNAQTEVAKILDTIEKLKK